MKDEKGIRTLVVLAGAAVAVQVVGGAVAYFTGAWVAAWAGVAIATAGLVAGMVAVVKRRWAGPVRRLAGTAGEMARGNWSAHALPGGADEVTELAVQVNAMAAKARQQLAGLEEQWRVVRALVDTLPDPVMLVEGHRRVTLVNSAAGRLLGVTPARAAGRWLGEVVKDRALLETFEEVPAVVGGNGAESARPVERQVVVDRDGQRVTYQAVAVRTADGVLLVLRDVTALAETVRIKTDFVANASHELRTPIAAIKAAFETLRDVYGEDPGQADRCVRIIDGHLRRLEEMLRDLLDLSRLESAELTVEPTAVRPAEVFSVARGALGEMAADKGVELRASLDGEAEPFAADVRLLNMVVKNLVENAIKFTPVGGTVEVSVARAEGNRAVVLSVRDTGIGIPPEHVNRVFERFYQVDPARTGSAGRGTGLGLAIVKHAVGAMGGTVSIESRVGEGTVVTCTLPQAGGSSVGV